MEIREILESDDADLLRVGRISRRQAKQNHKSLWAGSRHASFSPRSRNDHSEAAFISIDLAYHPDEHLIVAEADKKILAYVHVGILDPDYSRRIEHAERYYLDRDSPLAGVAFERLLLAVEQIGGRDQARSVLLWASGDDDVAQDVLRRNGYAWLSRVYARILPRTDAPAPDATVEVCRVRHSEMDSIRKVSHIGRLRESETAARTLPEDLFLQFEPFRHSDEAEAHFLSRWLEDFPNKHLLVARVDNEIVAFLSVALESSRSRRWIHAGWVGLHVDTTSPMATVAVERLVLAVEHIAGLNEAHLVELGVSSDLSPAIEAFNRLGYRAWTDSYYKILPYSGAGESRSTAGE